MALTTAERQRSWRLRQAERLAELVESDGTLRLAVADLERRLADALAEAEQLRECQCKHPSQLVSGGRCHGCGADVW